MLEIDKKAVGQRIKHIRINKHETMEQFAERFGSSKSNVSRWERGVNTPNIRTIEQIAEIGNTTVNEILYGTSYVSDEELSEAYSIYESLKETSEGEQYKCIEDEDVENLLKKAIQSTKEHLKEFKFLVSNESEAYGSLRSFIEITFLEYYDEKLKTDGQTYRYAIEKINTLIDDIQKMTSSFGEYITANGLEITFINENKTSEATDFLIDILSNVATEIYEEFDNLEDAQVEERATFSVRGSYRENIDRLNEAELFDEIFNVVTHNLLIRYDFNPKNLSEFKKEAIEIIKRSVPEIEKLYDEFRKDSTQIPELIKKVEMKKE